MAALLFVGTAQAQTKYIGGSLRISGGLNQNTTTGDVQNTFSLGIAPDFGWNLGDKWAVGIRPSAGLAQSVSGGGISRNYILGINPYARYQLLTYKRLGLWAEAAPELTYTVNNSQTAGDETLDSNSYQSRNLGYALSIVPVLTFNLSSCISLETRLNFFSFALRGNHIRYDEGGAYNTFTYGLQLTMENAVDILDNLSIGVLYHF